MLASAPYLVDDLNVDTPSSWPQAITGFQGNAYFVATDPANGRELWKSDGTIGGTALVKNIGLANTFGTVNDPNFSIGLTASGNALYFVANDGSHGRELWKTDGTADGTVMVKDIYAGSSNGFTLVGAALDPTLTDVNGTLFFIAENGAHGRELWTSDGTAAGTAMVKNIAAGSNSPFSTVSNAKFVVSGGSVYFTANSGAGYRLWKSDGTSAGTVEVLPSGLAAASETGELALVDGTMYFAGNSGATGFELWRSDGTVAGTSLVRDVRPGTASSGLRALTAAASRLYFLATDATVNGEELWTSDGTAAGTLMLKDIRPGSAGASVEILATIGDTVYFSAIDSSGGVRKLWKSDGTPDGTTIVRDFAGGGMTSTTLYTPCVIGEILYFCASDGTTGAELWSTDGTMTGTALVRDINSGAPGSLPTGPGRPALANVGGALYFAAADLAGGELWRSEGTAATTRRLRDIGTVSFGGYNASSLPSPITSMDGKSLFSARSPNGRKIWTMVDGGAPTVVNAFANYTLRSDNSSKLVAFKDAVYFSAQVGWNDNYELWKSNGSIAGTTLVETIHASSIFGSHPSNFTVAGDYLYFVANDGTAGYELWRTDGTSQGTMLVSDIYPGAASSGPAYLTAVGNVLYFLADDGVHGGQIWRSDGTAAGTRILKELESADGVAGRITAYGDMLYFSSYYGDGPVYKSDGTEAGTTVVAQLPPGVGPYAAHGFTASGGWLYFFAEDDVAGRELWRTDGTSAGTTMVADIRPGAEDGVYSDALSIDVGGILYFTADDGVTGEELWMYDGGPNPPQRVADLLPGGNGSNISSLTADRGFLYFIASNETGLKVWLATGAQLTMLETFDPASGLNYANPNKLSTDGARIYFAATTFPVATELWAAPTVSAARALGDYDFDGSASGADFLLWQRSLGGRGPAADGDGDGTVDADDLGAWRAGFPGAGVATASSSTTASVGASVDASVAAAVEAAGESSSDHEPAGAPQGVAAATDAVFAAGDFTRLFATATEDGGARARNYRPRRRI